MKRKNGNARAARRASQNYTGNVKGIRQMMIEDKERVYAKHIMNAYLEPDDRVDPGIVLELNKGLIGQKSLRP